MPDSHLYPPFSWPEPSYEVADIHYPEHSTASVAAVFKYRKHNKVDGIVLMGDQAPFNEVSHWTSRQ